MKPKNIVCLMGLPLTGKTTLGEALSRSTGLHFVDIDAGPAHCAPPQEPNPLRDDESTLRERKRMLVAYTVLHTSVAANLEAGNSIIIAATYSRKSSQGFLQKAIEGNSGTLKLIWCTFNDTPEEIERRVNDRISSGEIGGCRSVSHYLADKNRYEGTELSHLKVNSSNPLDACVAQALEFIKK